MGHPVPTWSPMGWPTFFFFRHTFGMFGGHLFWRKQWIGVKFLQNHTYGHASGRGTKWFWCGHFSSSYLSKITQKKHSVSHNIVMKSLIGWYFAETCLWTVCRDSQKWFGWGHFSSSYLSKITQKAIPLSPHIVKNKSDRAEILQKHTYGQSTGTVKNGLAEVIFHGVIWVKLLKAFLNFKF